MARAHRNLPSFIPYIIILEKVVLLQYNPYTIYNLKINVESLFKNVKNISHIITSIINKKINYVCIFLSK